MIVTIEGGDCDVVFFDWNAIAKEGTAVVLNCINSFLGAQLAEDFYIGEKKTYLLISHSDLPASVIAIAFIYNYFPLK